MPGESPPSSTMTVGVSPRALETMPVAILPTPKKSAGITKVGMTITEMSVRRVAQRILQLLEIDGENVFPVHGFLRL